MANTKRVVQSDHERLKDSQVVGKVSAGNYVAQSQIDQRLVTDLPRNAALLPLESDVPAGRG